MEITTNPFIVMTKADFEAAIAQIATRLQPVQSINQPAPAPPPQSDRRCGQTVPFP